MSQTKTFLATITFLFLVFVLLPAGSAAEIGLKLSPTRLTPTVSVGDETVEVITLQNESAEDMAIHGQINYGQQASEPVSRISLDPEEIVLKPGESGKVNIRITIPSDAEAGQRQAIALFNAKPASGGEIAIVGQVSSLIDVAVIHPVDQVEWHLPVIVDSSSPVSFAVDARNAGNFSTGLQEKVELTGLGGTVNLQSEERITAVGERARLETSWEEAPIFAFKQQVVSVGANVGAPIEKKLFLIVFPWKFFLVLLLVILTAIAGYRMASEVAKVFRGNWRKGH